MPGRYFTEKELSCRCGCGLTITNQEHLDRLDALREEVGAPLIVSSGARCPAHNKAIGGAPRSAHALPDPVATDIKCIDGWIRFKIVRAAFKVGFRRIEWGTKTWIHVDSATIETGHPQDVLFLP